jgi:ribosomal protein S18 acetylase RimI-like enzyme
VIDVHRMQALAQEVSRLEGALAPFHVGDVAWQVFSRGPGEWRIRFWERGSRDVAWAWLKLPNKLDYCVHPADRDDALQGELLDWFEAEAEGDELVSWAQSTDEPMLNALRRRGYEEGDLLPFAVHEVELDSTAVPEAPGGFRLRTVGQEDLEARVELHQIVWEPSRVTAGSYAELTRHWPYRADLDCVVEAPGGGLAAYCLAWLDDENAAGLFEPVGTHPDFRRLGLGSAVCRFALHRLREEGARHAKVLAIVDPANMGAKLLYESVGFREVCRASRLVKHRTDEIRPPASS